MNGHPDPHTLALLIGGDLDSVATTQLALHVHSCAECRQSVAELERAQALLRAAFAEPSEVDLEGVRTGVAETLNGLLRTKRWSWFSGSALATLVVFVSIAMMHRHSPQSPVGEEAVLLPPAHVPLHLTFNIPDVKRPQRSRPTPSHNRGEAGLRTVNFVARADGTTQFRVTTADPNVVIFLSPIERTVEQ